MMCDNCLHFPICPYDDVPDECPYFLSNDLVEVVRCENCKHYISGTCRRIIDGTERYCEVRKPSDYCSYGERKDAE